MLIKLVNNEESSFVFWWFFFTEMWINFTHVFDAPNFIGSVSYSLGLTLSWSQTLQVLSQS